ncbi:MAG: DNRLRE domain-containing protein [Promethearchaeota archaeon]
MKFKKTILILSIIILGFSCFLIPTRADIKTISSIKAASVTALNPDTNYGNDVDLAVGGTLSTWCKTYIEFDIRNLPSNIQKVKLILNIYDLDAAMDLDIYIASDSWSESTVTWNNRPSRLETIGTAGITSTGVWSLTLTGVDLTLYGNYITFELDSIDTDFMFIRSDDTSSPPKIDIYPVESTTGGLPLGAIIGIIVGICAAAGIGSFLIIRSRKKKREELILEKVPTIEVSQPVAEKVPILTEPMKPKEEHFITSSVKPIGEPIITEPQKSVEKEVSEVIFCSKCGAKMVNNYCTACGAIKHEFIIENIQKVFDSSGIRVDLNMLRKILPMDDSEFNSKIFNLAERFNYKIELEMLHITEERKQDFINALIKSLAEKK